jgi:hypothetical protein
MVVGAIGGFLLHIPIYATVFAIWKRVKHLQTWPPLNFRTYLTVYIGGWLLVIALSAISLAAMLLLFGDSPPRVAGLFSPTQTVTRPAPRPTPIPTTRPTSTNAARTPRPTPTALLACLVSENVTAGHIGSYEKVCGTVLEEGEVPCGECAYGYYSYLALEGGFQIISYDWNFFSDSTSSWVGGCVQVVDKVESLSGKPAFVMGRADGYGGSECYTDSRGMRVCRFGDYFQACGE